MTRIKDLAMLLIETLKESVRDRAKGLAAALAYYQLLSVAPVAAFIIFMSGKVLGQQRLQEDVLPLMKSSISPQLTKVIIMLLSTKQGLTEDELYTMSFFSGLLLLWAAKSYFGMIKQIVLTTWNKRRFKFGFKERLKRNIGTFIIALATVSLLMVAISIIALLPHPHVQTGEESNLPFIHRISEWTISFVLVTVLRIFYFSYIPPVKVNWRNTIPGAILGALLFLIGKEIMSTHFSERPDADVDESIVMVLIWFYYSGLTIIYSAEFTKLYVMKKQNIKMEDLKFD